MITLLVYAFLSIVVSFLCSIWEAVLLSVTPSFVEIEASKKTRLGDQLHKMKSNIDRPLSAILTLNTIAHTVGAIGVGAQAAYLWGSSTPWINLNLGFTKISLGGEAIVAAIMTLGILLLSEIIPKTIGASRWKSLVGFTVTSVRLILFILAPLVWVSQLITKFLKTPGHGSVLSRQGLLVMADIGAKTGVIKKGESQIINNLLNLETVQAKDIMTPRTVLVVGNEDILIGDFYKNNPNLRFSRIPIFTDNKDKIHGFVLKDEILDAIIKKKENQPLNSLKREITILPENMPLPDLFNKLLATKQHIALVVDEFGGAAGIVTQEDIIETLLGLEIVDELDGTTDLQLLARKNWEKRAKTLGLISEDENTN